ncbi:MAG: nucleotidyl transferase AbiEii/AbiGii toxin family protein [Myxococcota bacterium]
MTFDPSHEEVLRAVQARLGVEKVVVIGAAAVGARQLTSRLSDDLDLAIAVDLDDYPGAIAGLPGWRQHPKKAQRWLAPNDLPVDILPAGGALRGEATLRWPDGFEMSMVGMDLPFRSYDELPLRGGSTVRVASVPALVVLKMRAWLDRPARTRDLADLALLLEDGVPDDDPRRFDPDLYDRQGLGFETVGPFLVGRDIGAIAGPAHRDTVRRFVREVPQATWASHGPVRWRTDEDEARRALDACLRGMDSTNHTHDGA